MKIFEWVKNYKFPLTPFQDGGVGQKGPPNSFSPVTSTNVRINPQNFLTFIFNSFSPLM